MIKVPRIGLVENTARALVRELGIAALPVCPISIAEARGIQVSAKPMDSTGCSGMLVRLGNEFGILYATHVANDGYQRFSIAHELGHYFLPDHPDHVLQHGFHASHAGFSCSDPYEVEADFFAANLLMPPALFRQAAAKYLEGLTAIQRLADDCGTSLVATAISYAKHSHAAVAIILSTGGVVDCCFQSDALKSAKVGWLRKGTPLPPNVLSRRLSSDLRKVQSAHTEVGEIDLADWFGCAEPYLALEEAIGLGKYGKVLTVIHCSRLTARAEEIDDEDDEEEALVESWTPRFRRR